MWYKDYPIKSKHTMSSTLIPENKRLAKYFYNSDITPLIHLGIVLMTSYIPCDKSIGKFRRSMIWRAHLLGEPGRFSLWNIYSGWGYLLINGAVRGETWFKYKTLRCRRIACDRWKIERTKHADPFIT